MKTLKNKNSVLVAAAMAATVAGTLLTPSISQAQSLSPMRQLITSHSNQFAIKVHPHNPYRHRIKMVVKVYDQNFKLVKARVTPRVMNMGANTSRQVTVVVPFEGKQTKKIRICAESTPYPRQATKIKARVCGRFMAKRAR